MDIFRATDPRVCDRVAVTAAELAETPADWASQLRHSAVMDGGSWHSVLSLAVAMSTLPHLLHAALDELTAALVIAYTDQVRDGALDVDADGITEAAQRALFAGDRRSGSYAVPDGWDLAREHGAWVGDQYLTAAAVDYLRHRLVPAHPNPDTGDPAFHARVAAAIAEQAAL